MKKTSILVAGVILIGAGLAYVSVQWFRSKSSEVQLDLAARPTSAEQRNSAQSNAGSGILPDPRAKVLEAGFNALFNGLKKRGFQERGSVSSELEKAVATGDEPAIARAFSDSIHDRYAKMAEVIPTLRSFLGHKSSFVRVQAAQSLYVVGDNSGYQTLLEIIRQTDVVGANGQDLRVPAARSLGTYREFRALDDIVNLFRGATEQRAEIAAAFAPLGACPEECRKLPLAIAEHAITQCGQVNLVELLPSIRAVFENPQRPSLKTASAWAIAVMAGDSSCVDYLIGMSQPAINAKLPADWSELDVNATAVRYLGSIQQSNAKRTLEQALDSPNGQVVTYALVNLIFNQGGSAKAHELIVRELNGGSHVVPDEILFQVASKIRDGEITAAGEANDRRTSNENWRVFAGVRGNWPIYNWIDQYVVKLNESAQK